MPWSCKLKIFLSKLESRSPEFQASDTLPEDRIFPAAHPLVSYRSYVFISRLLEENGHGSRQIFIDLETHSPSAYADSGSRLSWCKISAA